LSLLHPALLGFDESKLYSHLARPACALPQGKRGPGVWILGILYLGHTIRYPADACFPPVLLRIFHVLDGWLTQGLQVLLDVLLDDTHRGKYCLGPSEYGNWCGISIKQGCQLRRQPDDSRTELVRIFLDEQGESALRLPVDCRCFLPAVRVRGTCGE